MIEKIQIPLVRPTLVDWETVRPDFETVWQTGQLTTGPFTAKFEQGFCKVTTAKHAVGVSSCTSGMMLLLRAMGIAGEVICPSFTWASTGHALVWNGITPVFADCTPGTYTLDPEDVKRKITKNTGAIFAANVFGLHPDMGALLDVAKNADVPLLCDSAQAVGASYFGRQAGSIAHAEVFSLSPTKVVTAVEGGIITTDDDALAARLYQLRDYGKSNDGQDVELLGLSARLSEFHAIVGAANLTQVKKLIAARNEIAELYRDLLSVVPGISFQTLPEGYETSWNYFVIVVDRRNRLQQYLLENGIQTKRYFYPPLHKLTSYGFLNLPKVSLPVTENACAKSLALPFYSHMETKDVHTVAQKIIAFYNEH